MATLVLGLSDNSRIKRKISDTRLSLDQMLSALMVDSLQFLAWTKTKSAQRNQGKPDSLFNKLMGNEDKPKDDLMSFKTPEEYEQYMKRIRGLQ